jgi:hypothetical protein
VGFDRERLCLRTMRSARCISLRDRLDCDDPAHSSHSGLSHFTQPHSAIMFATPQRLSTLIVTHHDTSHTRITANSPASPSPRRRTSPNINLPLLPRPQLIHHCPFQLIINIDRRTDLSTSSRNIYISPNDKPLRRD